MLTESKDVNATSCCATEPSTSPESPLVKVDYSENSPLLDFKHGSTTKQQRRRIEKFYSKQVDFVKSTYDDKEHIGKNGEDDWKFLDVNEKRARRYDTYLAKSALILNVILLVAKAVAAYLSGSLAVISTVIESAVDITSGITIWLTIRAIENTDPFEYPRGRAKLEPLAIIIVSTVMGIASLQVIIQAVQSITDNKVDPDITLPTLIIVGVTVSSKVILLIFCLRQKTPNAKLLALDQRNDILTNTFAIIAAIIGDKYWSYADPLGAIIVSSFVMGCWFYVAAGQVPILSGKRASTEYINRIITLCYDHEPPIERLDKVLVYHYGTKFLVEVRFAMSPEARLREAQAIVTTLGSKLELLPDVERAFVSAVCREETVKNVPKSEINGNYIIDGFVPE